MMKVGLGPLRLQTLVPGLVAAVLMLTAAAAFAQGLPGTENGEWRYLGGDAGHTRSAPQLNQIDASTFSELQVAWIWRGDNYGSGVEYTVRSTPVFVDGVLYTVAGQRRQVVAIDATTGRPLENWARPYRWRTSPRPGSSI